MRARSRMQILGGLAVIAAALSGCVADPVPRPSSPSPAPTLAPTPAPSPSPADLLAGMGIEDRVALLFMVGTSLDEADPAALAALTDRHVGGIFLRGRSAAGMAATADLVGQFARVRPPASPPLWVATDQEGGEVQVLSGPGFDEIPDALAQGADPAALRGNAARWAAQLAAAGVTMNLAPVADIVASPDAADQNAPIGALRREYGFDENAVVAGAGAFAEGMRDAGILPTLKHFPGLGRVSGNTDYSADVVDTEIAADSPDVGVYRRLLAEGPAVVMMSTAVYQRIDPAAPATFSEPVVTGLLRGTLGYRGVVMTDDLSATAQLERWSPADRAVLAVQAGVDLLLLSADARVFDEMYDAVLARARTDPGFAARVDESARRILTLKTAFG